MMIRTLSKALSNASSSPPSSPTHSRRFTFHALAHRLSESKKSFLEQIPHHQQQFKRLGKRTKNLLTSSVDVDERRSSSSSLAVSERFLGENERTTKTNTQTDMFNYLFRSLAWMKSIDALMQHMRIIVRQLILAFQHQNFFNLRY